ncbi:MAG: hypothetical protein KVP17_000014 [Porospora cf. gigantea B]|nr:MAG: hypothetical protein KVP17_000014 [Porospora cf. gigantea B]
MGYGDATAVTSQQDTFSFHEGPSAEQVPVDMKVLPQPLRFSDDFSYSLRLIPLRTTMKPPPPLCIREEPSISHLPTRPSILRKSAPSFKHTRRVHFADQCNTEALEVLGEECEGNEEALREACDAMINECEVFNQKNPARPAREPTFEEALREACDAMINECEIFNQKNPARPVREPTFEDAMHL